MRKILLLLTTLALSGCLLETVGPIDRGIKPYGAHWVKEGMTRESRRNDSWLCGAAPTEHGADHVVFTPEQRQSVRTLADKDDFGPDKHLLEKWRVCMRSKGYAHLEQCNGRCLHP